MRTASRLVFASVLGACASTDSPVEVVDALTQKGAPVLGLHCTLYHRGANAIGPGETGDEPKFQFAERTLDVGANERAEAALGVVRLEASYSAAGGEASFDVRVRAGDAPLAHSHFAFDPGAPPHYEFAGYHGLSGLVYVTAPGEDGSYQYICGLPSRAPVADAERMNSDADLEDAFRRVRAAKPVRLACTLQRAEGGRVEEKKFEVTPNEGGEQTLGGLTLGASYSDSEYDGSSFGVSVAARGKPLYHVLYQFSRADPPVQTYTDGAGFTGRVAVSVPGDAASYTYSCGVKGED